MVWSCWTTTCDLNHLASGSRRTDFATPVVQGVRDTLGEHVTVQIAKRSELHTLKVMPKRWIVEYSFA